MRDGRISTYCTEGSAALELGNVGAYPKHANILSFPGTARGIRKGALSETLCDLASAARAKVVDILESSEMYCSLKFEDYRGCAFNVFTRRGIAFLSASIFVIAAASIAFGA